MPRVARKRCGYLWMTDGEEEKLSSLIKTTSVLKTSDMLRAKADFVRGAALAIGELLRRKKVHFNKNISQDEAVLKIVETFSK